MRHTTILLLAFTFIFSYIQGQTPLTANQKRISHWYFGQGNHMWWDANGNVHIDTTTSPLHTNEGSSTICDTLGNVLFFTDGDTVWNRNLQVMKNGTGLMGCGNYGSSSQAGLIIQMPENDSLYYIFTTDCLENSGYLGLRYSLVNLKGDSGLGEVIQKNVLLQAPCTEGLAATFHANGKDVWLMAHGLYTNTYDCYKITKHGIQLPPVVAYVGGNATDVISFFSFSNKGDLFAANIADGSGTKLFRFNRELGILYDKIVIIGGNSKITFSPDDSKLYACFDEFISQQCIYVHDSVAISKSYKELGGEDFIDQYVNTQLGPDGKVYITRSFTDSIAVVNKPNLYSTACDFNINGLRMRGYAGWYDTITLAIPITVGFNEYLQSYNYVPNLTPNACDSTSSILYTPKLLHQAKVYPNPVYQNDITLELNKPLPKCPQKFFLIDMQGKKHELKAYMQGLDKFRLNVENIPQGVYILHIPEYPDIVRKIIISQP